MAYSSVILLGLLLFFFFLFLCFILWILFLRELLLTMNIVILCLLVFFFFVCVLYKGYFSNSTKAINLSIYVCCYVISNKTTLKVDYGFFFFKFTQHR